MNRDKPLFQIGEVASATGVPATTIRNWFHHGLVLLGAHDAKAEANGLPRLLSLATVQQIAAAGALLRLGVKAGDATSAALAWTEVGSLPGQPRRDPGGLFPDGHSLLCHFGSGKAEVTHVGTAANPMPWVTNDGASHAAVAIVHLNALDAGLRSRLPRKN